MKSATRKPRRPTVEKQTLATNNAIEIPPAQIAPKVIPKHPGGGQAVWVSPEIPISIDARKFMFGAGVKVRIRIEVV